MTNGSGIIIVPNMKRMNINAVAKFAIPDQ
jgi:hypothetical protein